MATAFVRRMREANARRLDLSQHLCPAVHRTINCHADAIGVPPEFIFYPLLTAVASCMGVNGSVRVNSSWVEPSILWFIVAAKKGEKKTAAVRTIRRPLEDIQKEMVEAWETDISDEKPKTPPQILVDNFSFEELHCVMKRNGNQVLGMFDEMSSFYAQLDLFKHTGSDFDWKTLITLNGGGPWTRNFRSYTATLQQTAFNITGFIQPAFVDRMLRVEDPDGFVDRQLFDFPPDRDVYLEDLKVPIPNDVPNLKDVFKVIIQNHQESKEYALRGDAYDNYRRAHDKLVDMKVATDNEDLQGIYAKSRGYVARLAMVLFVLEQATIEVSTTPPSDDLHWNTDIYPATVEAAAAIICHLNGQKEILMGMSSAGVTTRQERALPQYSRVSRMLRVATDKDDMIAPSILAQKHVSERVNGSYPVSKAVELLETAANLGFGELMSVLTPHSHRKVQKFKKTHYRQLGEAAKETLSELDISCDTYEATFAANQSPSKDGVEE